MPVSEEMHGPPIGSDGDATPPLLHQESHGCLMYVKVNRVISSRLAFSACL